MGKLNSEKKGRAVAVAIDNNKTSQIAMKWAVDNLADRGQTLTLIHVKARCSSSILSPAGNHVSVGNMSDDIARAYKQQLEKYTKELFSPFHLFCHRKNVRCNEVILENDDIVETLVDYITANFVEALVLGAPSKGGLVRRFRMTDIPSSVSKIVPDFCTVYVISKGKVSCVRSASGPPPAKPPSNNPLQYEACQSSDHKAAQFMPSPARGGRTAHAPRRNISDEGEIKSPFLRSGRSLASKSYELSGPESDISFVSNGRPSTDCSTPSLYDNMESGFLPRLSSCSLENDSGSSILKQSLGMSSSHDGLSSSSLQSGKSSSGSSQNIDDAEAEMRRLRLELKLTMEMYSTACKEAITAKQKAMELYRSKMEEQQKLETARQAEEAALALAEKEKAKCKAAMEAAEAAKRIAELEAQKRVMAEIKARKDTEKAKMPRSLSPVDLRYRRYTIEEIEEATEKFSSSHKIGEGGYGPVYRGQLDHTAVAIKVLRPDAAQGQSQFHQEVEVLSCIRHPNMVLLLGACPEYGCLVYEHLVNGSLEDRLLQQGNTPTLSWQMRFRIAAEIGTGLLFLHQTKPEPLVHRDLKPANILLDRNYVSKISDVGLARLVPPSVADSVTQYRMTSAAGTFCYIDPEYLQTGMLGIKSDIYSLGVLLLQLITAKPPMGLTHHVERAIKKGAMAEMLDPTVPDWPVEEALNFAKLALWCAQLRRKDRPDLRKVVLPELNRLRALAEENMVGGNAEDSPGYGQDSMSNLSPYSDNFTSTASEMDE